MHWTATIRAMAEDGVTHVVECGPGKVLAGLTKRIADTLPAYALTDGDALSATLAELRS